MKEIINDPPDRLIDRIKEASIDVLPALGELVSPEIITNPSLVIIKATQGIVSSLLNNFKESWEKSKKNGEVKARPITGKPRMALLEMLKSLEADVPDEEKFVAMQNIFLKSMEKDADAEAELKAYQLMDICKQLSGTEIIILKAAYEVAKDMMSSHDPRLNDRGTWLQKVARQMKHGIAALIESKEEHLESLSIISKRRSSPRDPYDVPPQFISTPYYRLTDLGYNLCEFITFHNVEAGTG